MNITNDLSEGILREIKALQPKALTTRAKLQEELAVRNDNEAVKNSIDTFNKLIGSVSSSASFSTKDNLEPGYRELYKKLGMDESEGNQMLMLKGTLAKLDQHDKTRNVLVLAKLLSALADSYGVEKAKKCIEDVRRFLVEANLIDADGKVSNMDAFVKGTTETIANFKEKLRDLFESSASAVAGKLGIDSNAFHNKNLSGRYLALVLDSIFKNLANTNPASDGVQYLGNFAFSINDRFKQALVLLQRCLELLQKPTIKAALAKLEGTPSLDELIKEKLAD